VRIAHAHSTIGAWRSEWKKNLLKYSLRPLSNLYATHLLACSEYAGRWQFGKGGKFTVIKNSIDTSVYRFSHDTRERVRKAFAVTDKLLVGNVGRFSPQKNHLYLIDVFAKIRRSNQNAMLVLIGDGPLKVEAESKATELGLTGSILFLGARDRDDVGELYQAFDVFVFPTLYEGLGLAVVEAQCSGLLCVVSDAVPEEAIVNGSTCMRLPVLVGAGKWAAAVEELVGCGGKNRKECSKEACRQWDISETVGILQGVYLSAKAVQK
jgi:glycosyltransferase involved in cell wall biosynthesis